MYVCVLVVVFYFVIEMGSKVVGELFVEGKIIVFYIVRRVVYL